MWCAAECERRRRRWKIINLNGNLDCRIKLNGFNFLHQRNHLISRAKVLIKACISLLQGNDRGGVFLVPMHGGIWTLCINLRDDEIRELANKGFPTVAQCFNYLAGNIDNSRAGGGDEPRADWQHSESQTPLHPHLSRYNNNVLNFESSNTQNKPSSWVLIYSFPLNVP